ncbi:MAG: PorT family protein [Bacteroidales bacterium]|nr:PorT family protein [Bacteroidales bacterium]
MKDLLRILFLIALITVCSHSQAQVSFGLKAGLSGNNIKQDYKDKNEKVDTKIRLGYHIGVIVDFAISDLSIQLGTMFSRKGYNSDMEDKFNNAENVSGYDVYNINYIEVPVNVALNSHGFQIFAGPYVAFGIGGKNKYNYSYTYMGPKHEDEGEKKLKPYWGEISEKDLDEEIIFYNALDLGMNLGLGFRAGPVLITATYSHGFSNLIPPRKDDKDYNKERKAFNRGLGLSLTCFLNQ